ncbi:MAG: hypothetical protein WC843_04165 [Candidatus Gracilibacteria bacterium]|jgi:C4-type Zn-finger protein
MQTCPKCSSHNVKEVYRAHHDSNTIPHIGERDPEKYECEECQNQWDNKK